MRDPGGELAVAAAEQLDRRVDLVGGPVVADRRDEHLLAQLDSIEWHRETHYVSNKNDSKFPHGTRRVERRGAFFSTAGILQRMLPPALMGAQVKPTRPELPREFVAVRKRRRMMDAMAELSAEQGYEATKIADIVRRAGVARKTLYDNFDGKEEVFLAAFDACRRGGPRRGRGGLRRPPTAAGSSGSKPASGPSSTSSPRTRRRRGCA